MAQSALMNIMVQAVTKAGRKLKRDFGEIENLQVSVKGPGDFVTNADFEAEKTLYEELKKARPKYGFLMEESGEEKGEDGQHRWIIDPLDGTLNFMHGIPHFAISLGLESQGVMQAGIVYNPITDELFAAEKGNGAFVNDKRLRVAGRRVLTDCMVATEVPRRDSKLKGQYLFDMRHVMTEVASVRTFGSAALNLAYVAAGRLDAYWQSELKPWDISAGLLLVQEAGGYTGSVNSAGSCFETGSVLAANDAISKKLAVVLKKAQTK